VRDLVFEDIVAAGNPLVPAGRLECVAEAPCEGVVFRRVSFPGLATQVRGVIVAARNKCAQGMPCGTDRSLPRQQRGGRTLLLTRGCLPQFGCNGHVRGTASGVRTKHLDIPDGETVDISALCRPDRAV
jgi:hypothetical protein